MASNGKPQFVKNIFLQQSKGGLAAAVDASVRQDKTALRAVHQPSPQPEPHQNPARSHPLNNNLQRAKKHGSSKRKTVQLIFWVNPIVKTELQRLAEQEGLSISKSGGTLLERALQQNIDMQYHAFLTPVIETVIRKEIRSLSNRLAMLLARTLFASEQTRVIDTNILARLQDQPVMTEEKLKEILSMSQKAAKGNLSRKTPPELIAAIEQWLLATDDEKDKAN